MPQARQISKRGGETDSGEFRQGLPFAAVEARLAFGVREVPTAADLALDSLAILGGVLGVPRPGLPAKRRVVGRILAGGRWPAWRRTSSRGTCSTRARSAHTSVEGSRPSLNHADTVCARRPMYAASCERLMRRAASSRSSHRAKLVVSVMINIGVSGH